MEILKGHVSEETAYVVDDYPYGFRLRCKIRYWLEHSKHGVRFCSQTTNPRREGEVWNKPKYSTYALISGAMYLDEKGYVEWSGLSEYGDYAEALKWNKTFREGVHPDSLVRLDNWLESKRRYEEKKASGMDWKQAGREVALEMIKEGKNIS